MAKAFGNTQGKASGAQNNFTFEDGTNIFRIVGGILPRYVYWNKTTEGKPIAIECLHFNRDTESFDRAEQDWHAELFPYQLDKAGNPEIDNKTGEPKRRYCSWAYAALCLTEQGEVKVMNLKKKMYAQIQTLANKLGDPTDPETGWWIAVDKTKTGPLAFNVEYTVDQLTSSEGKRPLTDAERAAVEKSKDIDELLKRPTPEEIHAIIREKILGESAGATTEDKEGVSDV